MPSNRKLAAIMFADIVGYTAMMQQDEARAKQARDRFRRIIDNQVSELGEVVQYYGDGALIIFSSAKESVKAAMGIQQQLQQQPSVPVRIGIHLGDVVQDKDGVFGDGVNIASRIESMAIPGSVLISDSVHQEISNDPGIEAVSLGVFQLKNVKLPVEVYAIRHRDLAVPGANELDQTKARNISKSIAIMPFSNMFDPGKPDYLAEGISEEIINGLSTVAGIDVISRSTCRAILQSQEDPLAIGRRLKVSHFLEGSVRSAGDRVRVSVHLVDTVDGYQLWSESYDRKLDDIFEVQDEIAHKVINGLKVSFDIKEREEAIVSKATDNIEAYTEHLKGLHHLKKGNPEEVKKAIDHFEEALRVDPGFSSAMCGLSQGYSFLGSCGVLPPVSAYAKALKYVMTAIEKNNNLAEAHLAMANIKFYHFWDWQGAKESLEKAITLGLNSAELYQSYGLYYAATGRPDQGIPKLIKALELDPLSVPVMLVLGTLYLFDEQYQKAISIFEEALELDPAYRAGYQYKGIAFACMKNYQQAFEQFQTYHQKVGHPQKALAGLIICHHNFGNPEKVDELMDRLYDRLKNDYSAAVEIDLAIGHAGREEYDAAVKFLESTYDKRLSIACMGMIWVMRCPCFKDLWTNPGFIRLKEKMGL